MHWDAARETPWDGKQILLTSTRILLQQTLHVALFPPEDKIVQTADAPFPPLLCQDTQSGVVHLGGLRGQGHCHGTNWPHWSDTQCFVSFVSQVPTCASQNKLPCNVARQKKCRGNMMGPGAPLKGNKCCIAELYCGFGCLPRPDTAAWRGT